MFVYFFQYGCCLLVLQELFCFSMIGECVIGQESLRACNLTLLPMDTQLDSVQR